MPQLIIQILPVCALKLTYGLEKNKTRLDLRMISIMSIGGRVTKIENQKSVTGEMLFINKKGLWGILLPCLE